MAVMVNGGGAGGGGGWIDITDSVTLGTGKQLKHGYKSKRWDTGHGSDLYSYNVFEFQEVAYGAYVRIDDVKPGERYRVTGWRAIRMAYLDENDEIITGQYIPSSTAFADSGSGWGMTSDELVDAYGYGSETCLEGQSTVSGYQKVTNIYAPMEFAIPKRGVKSVFVSHAAVFLGSTYDDVIVEKYIG